MSSQPTVYRYVGPETFPGVPKRDLTQADVDELSIDRKRDVEASASYELVGQELPAGDPSDAWTRAQLDAYGQAHGIAYPSKANKATILAAIAAANAPVVEPPVEPTDPATESDESQAGED